MKKELPSGWQEFQIKDICSINYGKGLGKNNIVEGNIPVYSSGGIIGYHNESLINSKGVIIGRKGNAGSVFYSNSPFFCIDTAFYVEPNDNIDLKFLYYKLISIKLERHKIDSAVPGINRDTIYSISITVPPIDEQKRIADILSAFDDLIENLNKLIAKKEIYKKGVMQRVLSGKVRFNGFKDEWKTISLCKILEERKTFKHKDGNLEHVSLTKEGVVPKSERYERDFLVKDKNKQYKITKINDICYNPANLKFGVICKNNYGEGIFSPIYVTFEVNKGFNIDLISYILKSESFINNARRYEEGTVYERKAVSPENLLSIKIKIPSLEEQNKIAELLTLIDKDIDNLKQILQLRKLQKKGVMQKLLTGEVRV